MASHDVTSPGGEFPLLLQDADCQPEVLPSLPVAPAHAHQQTCPYVIPLTSQAVEAGSQVAGR